VSCSVLQRARAVATESGVGAVVLQVAVLFCSVLQS